MNHIYKLLLIFILAIVAAPNVDAQKRQKLSNDDRQTYLAEIKNYKHEYLARELNLTKEQQREFWPVYDELDVQLNQISDEIRQYERKLSDTDMNNTEYSAAARALFEQKQREGNLEMQYFDKFQKILTPKQMAQLKVVERSFVRHLMSEHHNRRQK